MMRVHEAPRTTTRLSISAGAEWFQVGEANATILETRIPLRRLLLALGELRLRTPNAVLPVTAAFEAGWPGERATPTAAAMRVYTAIHSLRRLGLKGILVRRRRGYVLDADVQILANESQIPPGVADYEDVSIPPSSRAPTESELSLTGNHDIDEDDLLQAAGRLAG